MTLENQVATAAKRGATDLHLETGLPAALRIKGEIKSVGEPIPSSTLTTLARTLVGDTSWKAFQRRKSHDLSKTISGVRCRINVFQTQRGIGIAVRLLSTFQPTIERLNLHPDLRKLVHVPHGLVIISGPTGSGKSSTLAALIHEINSTSARHIVTIELPIEFTFRPRRAFIRQREVGRDTPSFDQGLLDAMREDPDVLVVGEMRHPETMRLTLNAAETGHLVLTTMHSANCVEALHRLSNAFAPEILPAMRGQLADCLRAVVCQRLNYRANLGMRLPELEILKATTPIRSLIRQGSIFKIQSSIETGQQDGQWTYERYRNWMEGRHTWFVPDDSEKVTLDSDIASTTAIPPIEETPAASSEPRIQPEEEQKDVIVIDPPKESIGDILSELDDDSES